MVDVGEKAVSQRMAIAKGQILLQPETLRLIEQNAIAKGNVLAVARIAGIQAAKQTSMLIPLCHNLNLTYVEVEFRRIESGFEIAAQANTQAQTGVEMEALTAVSIAALTIYDMCKAVDQQMRIEGIHLETKQKCPI